MSRMKTFLLYFLGIVGFFILSLILEDALIGNMYKKMDGNIQDNGCAIVVEGVSGRATNVNGYMQFRLSNTSSAKQNNYYAKIDLYSKQGLLAATKYVDIGEIEPGTYKDYNVKFKGTELKSYDISVISSSQLPDKTNIIDIFGWEIDLSDVFGMDLTNATIFGVKLTDLFSWNGIKNTAVNGWRLFWGFASNIPWWGYAIGAGIILWTMPSRFLFGIFTF